MGKRLFCAVWVQQRDSHFLWSLFSAIFYCSAKGHHKSKDTNADKNIIVRVYYGNYYFFGYCCVAQEVFYLLLYVLYFEPAFSFDVAGTTITLEQVCCS
jgi:hypothetical protein